MYNFYSNKTLLFGFATFADNKLELSCPKHDLIRMENGVARICWTFAAKNPDVELHKNSQPTDLSSDPWQVWN